MKWKQSTCDSKRGSWPWILAPSLTSFTNHLTLGWLSSVSKFLTSSHTDIAYIIGKITPHWLVEGIFKALWGEELVPWLVHGESSIFAHLCPLIVVLGESDSVQTLWIPQGQGPLITCVCVSHNTQRGPASQKQDSEVTKSRDSGTKVPRWSLMPPLSATWTWGNYLRSLWLGFIICQTGVIIVLVSWRCYEVYLRVWPQ